MRSGRCIYIYIYICVCVCVCVCACVRACVRACVLACLLACLLACILHADTLGCSPWWLLGAFDSQEVARLRRYAYLCQVMQACGRGLQQ